MGIVILIVIIGLIVGIAKALPMFIHGTSMMRDAFKSEDEMEDK